MKSLAVTHNLPRMPVATVLPDVDPLSGANHEVAVCHGDRERPSVRIDSMCVGMSSGPSAVWVTSWSRSSRTPCQS